MAERFKRLCQLVRDGNSPVLSGLNRGTEGRALHAASPQSVDVDELPYIVAHHQWRAESVRANSQIVAESAMITFVPLRN